MKKNNLWKTFVLTLIVMAALFALFYIPRFKVGDVELRRVNILSDVQNRDKDGNILAEVKADSADGIKVDKLDTMAVKVKRPVFVDSIPEGMTAIEDFASTNGYNREMDHFYNALAKAGSSHVRIAYFGDSFIEGDILTMDLRNMFQSKYGGKGPGLVEINCVSSGFRRTVSTRASGWSEHHANAGSFNSSLSGIAGSYFIPSGSASYEIRGQKNVYANRLDTMDVATVYFTPGSGLSLSYSINGGSSQSLYGGAAPQPVSTADSSSADSGTHVAAPRASTSEVSGGSVVAKSVNGRIGSFRLSASGGSSSRVYGVALDGKAGVSVDNFSMRGSAGYHLTQIPVSTLKGFAQVRPYDLIIIQFGLNVANAKQKDYSAYIQKMGQAIDNFKAAFPHASILVVSMGDRGKRGSDGQIHTMPGVQELVSYERKMASDHRVAFWNLYEAMGGDGSIARMKEKKQANLDYTHINFDGGKYVAKLLFDVLVNGKDNYNKREN